MPTHIITNHFTFHRTHFDTSTFHIQSLTLCSIHDQLPPNHYPLTDPLDTIVTVQKNNSTYYLIYSICTESNIFYNLFGCQKDEHEFVLNGNYYKIDKYKCVDRIYGLYLCDGYIKYNVVEMHNRNSEKTLVLDGWGLYKSRSGDSLEKLVVMVVNAYRPKVVDKMFCLVVYVQKCAYYLYCVQRIESRHKQNENFKSTELENKNYKLNETILIKNENDELNSNNKNLVETNSINNKNAETDSNNKSAEFNLENKDNESVVNEFNKNLISNDGININNDIKLDDLKLDDLTNSQFNKFICTGENLELNEETKNESIISETYYSTTRCDIIMSKHYFLSFYFVIYFDIDKSLTKRLKEIEIKIITSLEVSFAHKKDLFYLPINNLNHDTLPHLKYQSIIFKSPTNLFENAMGHLNSKTLIYILRTIFSEQKLVLLSKSTSKLCLTINFIKNCLFPFTCNNTTFSILHNNLMHMLDLPFPFIFGIRSTIKEIKTQIAHKDIVIIDIDSNTTNCKIRPKLPYEDSLLYRLENENWSNVIKDFLIMIQNNVDIAREKMLHANINTDHLFSLINRPKLIIEKINSDHINFYKRFFETKTFRDYVYDQHTSTNNIELCLTECTELGLGTSCADLLYVYKLWHTLAVSTCMEGDVQLNIDCFNNTQVLLLLPYLFDIFSRIRNYSEIRKLYSFMIANGIQITPEMYKNINLKTQKCDLGFFKFYDLNAYTIKISKIVLNELCQTDNKIYVYKYEVLMYKIPILSPKSIVNALTVLNLEFDKETMLNKNHVLFWNIMLYLKILNLPINITNKDGVLTKNLEDLKIEFV